MAHRRRRNTNNTQDAKLATLTKPEFVTLCKNPANTAGFKIIRNAAGGEQTVRTRSKQKNQRADDTSLLSITLPDDVSHDEAVELMDRFGLGENYEVAERDSGGFDLARCNAEEVSTLPISMGQGVFANIDVAAFAQRSAGAEAGMSGVTLSALTFSCAERFADVKQVRAWLESSEIDFQQGCVSCNNDGSFTVKRHEATEDSHVVAIADGVTGVIVRSEETDVPSQIRRSVLDTAYGSWGWGHLDFAAAFADPEYTDKAWDALYVLRDVLENIMFYCTLPLAERKALKTGALNQYDAFMNALMDALPTGVVEQVKNSEQLIKRNQESVMSKKKEDDKGAAPASNASAQVTRAEVGEMIETAVAGAAKTFGTMLDAKLQTRSGEGTEADGDGNEEGTEEGAEAGIADSKSIRSMQESISAIAESITGLTKKVDDMGETTHVNRSEGEDEEEQQQRSEGEEGDSIFAGCLGSLGRK